MSKNPGVVPLAELDGYRSETLAWDLTLPEYVPAEQIGVNVGLLGKIARLGGLGHVRVGAYDGERTQYQAEVSSTGADGSTTAGMKATLSKAETIEAKISATGSKPSSPYSEYWWADATIDVNATELGDKIMEQARNGASVRDGSLWARHLNKDIRQGLSQASRQQLLGNVSGLSQTFLGLTLGFVPLWARPDFTPENVSINFLLLSCYEQGLSTVMNQTLRGISAKERRLSLIPAYQIDRLFAAQSLLKTRKLVKPLKGTGDSTD